MTRRLVTAGLALLIVALIPAPSYADATAFWGFSPTPASRSTKGLAFGIGLIIVGFEFEYANTTESVETAAPSLKTGMINGLLQTPTHTQLYLTAGGGFFRERLAGEGETNIGTNIGGGIKIGLAGPLRLRLDYRVFNLRGTPLYPHPQRFYAGVNFSF
jgi:hypothetical protein